MKRKILLSVCYLLVFGMGYLAVGITLHFLKPTVKLLPEFIVNTLPKVDSTTQSSTLLTTKLFDYKTITDYAFDTTTSIFFDNSYGAENGIFCFRGNAQRNNPTRGTLEKTPTTLLLDWSFETDFDDRVTEFGTWGGGTGWTGQPLIVKWPFEQKQKMQTLNAEHKTDDGFKEVAIGSLCGNIYFLDIETGKPSRPHLSIGNPIKGTISIDPKMSGLMTVGQGIPNGDRFGAYLFDLYSGKEIGYRSGLDPTARRQWGAYDSNPLFESDRLFWPAENGQIYKYSPSVNGFGANQKFNYTTRNQLEQGLEASFGAHKNLGFFGDNSGTVFCLNLDKMQPVWYFFSGDDSDASMVVDNYDQQNPVLFIGNEVDKQGATGWAYIRKLDALTGKEIWKTKRNCSGTRLHGRTNSGGVLATVLLGKKTASNLVFGIFSRVNNTTKGEFVAIDKTTGKEKYSIQMDAYSWASPIALYDKQGNGFVFFTDVYGTVYLIEALTGKLMYKRKTNYVFESSPVAWGNRIVVGTRGRQILSFLVE